MALVKRVQLILVRHAQTDFNAQCRITGGIDVPLNDTGRTQASDIAVSLLNKSIQAIFSSDLKRARETAEKIARFQSIKLSQTIDVIQDPRLREVSCGKIDGLSPEEARNKYPEERFQLKNPGFDLRSIGGERECDVLERQLKLFSEIAETFGTEEKPHPLVVVVGHGTALRIFLRHCGIATLHEQGKYQIVTYP